MLGVGGTNTGKIGILFSEWFYWWRQTWRHMLFWGGGHAVQHAQLSQSENKPMPPALEVWGLNYWGSAKQIIFNMIWYMLWFRNMHAICCSCSVTQLRDPMWPHGLQHTRPHHLPEFAQVHVHCIGNAIQPSHPLVPSSPSAPNLSEHQGLFQLIIWEILEISSGKLETSRELST